MIKVNGVMFKSVSQQQIDYLSVIWEDQIANAKEQVEQFLLGFPWQRCQCKKQGEPCAQGCEASNDAELTVKPRVGNTVPSLDKIKIQEGVETILQKSRLDHGQPVEAPCSVR